MYIGENGTLTMDTVDKSGFQTVIGESFPSMEKCYWYMDNVQTPFHDLLADLDLPGGSGLSNRIDHEEESKDGQSFLVSNILISLIFSAILF